MFPGKSRHRAKIFSRPKYCLGKSILWTEVFPGLKCVWGQSMSGAKVSVGWKLSWGQTGVTYFLLKQSLKSTFLVILVPMLIRGCVCTATTLFQYANGICYYCFSNVTDTALKSIHVHIQFFIDLSNCIEYAKITHLIYEKKWGNLVSNTESAKNPKNSQVVKWNNARKKDIKFHKAIRVSHFDNLGRLHFN